MMKGRILVVRSARTWLLEGVLDKLRARFPFHSVDVLAHPRFIPELEGHPAIGEAIPYPGGKFSPWGLGWRGLRDIRKRNYDAMAILWNNPRGIGYFRAELMALLCGARRMLVYNSLGQEYAFSGRIWLWRLLDSLGQFTGSLRLIWTFAGLALWCAFNTLRPSRRGRG
ncbi:MAG: glycosyltransferase family 9 protein [bacterium]